MTDVVSMLSDRLLAVFVPRATAEASENQCLNAPPEFCSCYGSRASYRKCMKCSDGSRWCTDDCPLTYQC